MREDLVIINVYCPFPFVLFVASQPLLCTELLSAYLFMYILWILMTQLIWGQSADQRSGQHVQYCFYGCPIMRIVHAKINTDRFLVVGPSFCWQFPSFKGTSCVYQFLEKYLTGRFTKLCPFPKSENKYRQNKGNQRDLPVLVKLGNHTGRNSWFQIIL